MADDSGQEKTEDPTAKRLNESRNKGQVPRSKELNTFITLMTASTMLMFFVGPMIGNGLLKIMRQQFQLTREVIFDEASLIIYFEKVLLEGISLIFPLAIPLIIAALLTPMMMGGWNFTTEALQPKISKLNPITGVKKLFGINGIVELIKALIKTILVFFVAGNLLSSHFEQFMELSSLPLEGAIYKVIDIILFGFFILSATLVLIVVIDVPYQLWSSKKKLKMTKQEVKDEQKQTEGDPQIKGQIRRKQMDMAQQRMMNDVPTADVIVTNPAHYAIALKYDPLGTGAPILVAKGVDLIAAQIRNTAMAADITLVAAPPLARALYYSTELGQEIPKGLFLAVAQVLAYVFQLKTATENFFEKPLPPNNLKVPNEFRQY